MLPCFLESLVIEMPPAKFHIVKQKIMRVSAPIVDECIKVVRRLKSPLVDHALSKVDSRVRIF